GRSGGGRGQPVGRGEGRVGRGGRRRGHERGRRLGRALRRFGRALRRFGRALDRLRGRGERLDDAVADEPGEKVERVHATYAEVLRDRRDVAVAVDREERAPALRCEGHRALVRGALG